MTSQGLRCDHVLSFVDDASALGCWSVRWRADDGREDHGLHVVLLEDARRAWWVVRDGHAVAHHELPARSGPTCACGGGRAEVPLDLPRQPNDHGRRRLAATQRT